MGKDVKEQNEEHHSGQRDEVTGGFERYLHDDVDERSKGQQDTADDVEPLS